MIWLAFGWNHALKVCETMWNTSTHTPLTRPSLTNCTRGCTPGAGQMHCCQPTWKRCASTWRHSRRFSLIVECRNRREQPAWSSVCHSCWQMTPSPHSPMTLSSGLLSPSLLNDGGKSSLFQQGKAIDTFLKVVQVLLRESHAPHPSK